MCCELGEEVLRRLEDVDVVRDWNLAKIAMKEGVDTGPKDIRGVGMAVVSEGRSVALFHNATEGGMRRG